MDNKKLVSLVLPIYNEEDVLYLLCQKIITIIDNKLGDYRWEIIFVDDGSKDNTLNILKELRSKDSRIKWLSLSRNFGHQHALFAGLEHAGGDAAITMDADIQHPVEIIPELVHRWETGYDVVITIRQDDPDLDIIKRFTSKAFYKVINYLSNTDIKLAASDFRLLSRKSLKAFLQLKEVHRFNRGIVSWMGFNTCEVSFKPNKRGGGHSKYTFKKMLSFALDGITSFSTIPLRISGLVGMVICLLSAPFALYAFVIWLTQPEGFQIGWTSLIVSVHFLGGSTLIFLGVIGEYIGKIYEQVKQRPIYMIKDMEGFEWKDGITPSKKKSLK